VAGNASTAIISEEDRVTLIAHEERKILLTLYHTLQARDGWKRRGVVGWLFIDEVDESRRAYIGDALNHLFRMRHIEKVDVRERGSGRAVNLYRITQSGLACIGEQAVTLDLPEAADSGLEDASLYMPRACWGALAVLRTQLNRSLGKRRFDEVGWMTAGEIYIAGQYVLSEELAWLVKRGFTVKRMVDRAGQPGRGPTFYRITERGIGCEMMQARGQLVQVVPPTPSQVTRRSHVSAQAINSTGSLSKCI
jgi:DNA-binding PadR family transcriptional regulator